YRAGASLRARKQRPAVLSLLPDNRSTPRPASAGGFAQGCIEAVSDPRSGWEPFPCQTAASRQRCECSGAVVRGRGAWKNSIHLLADPAATGAAATGLGRLAPAPTRQAGLTSCGTCLGGGRQRSGGRDV